jgi:hypothetical protein
MPNEERRVVSMPVAPVTTPMEMLARAVQMSTSPETLERLLSLQERWERNEARKRYDRPARVLASNNQCILAKSLLHRNSRTVWLGGSRFAKPFNGPLYFNGRPCVVASGRATREGVK